MCCIYLRRSPNQSVHFVSVGLDVLPGSPGAGGDQTRSAASMVPAMVRRIACDLQSASWMSAGNSNQKSVACRASSSLAALVADVCASS